MNKPNIIFLDIDGVLCTLRSHLALGHGLMMEAWDITSCQIIKKICKEHNCKLVISSTWRINSQRTLQYYLAVFGLIDYVYPSIFDTEDWKTPIGKMDCKRGDEIKEWLDNHKDDINDYLIFDDDSDMLEEQKDHFFQIDSDEGFGAKDFLKVEKYFERNN